MPTRHTDLPLTEKPPNPVVHAMSIKTQCLTQILSPEQRERFGKDLVTMAEVAGRKGKLELTSILLDMRAAVKVRDEEQAAERLARAAD